MLRQTIKGLLALRNIANDPTDKDVYVAVCRSAMRYVELNSGLAMDDYADVVMLVDTLPEHRVDIMVITNMEEFQLWYRTLTYIVELVVAKNQYSFDSTQMPALFRHLLSYPYWNSIKLWYNGNLSEFVFRNYLAPYMYINTDNSAHKVYGDSGDLEYIDISKPINQW